MLSRTSRNSYKPKPYEVDISNPSIVTIPTNVSLRPLRSACQTLEVNETLSIRWEDEHPVFCGMVALRSANRVASRADTA